MARYCARLIHYAEEAARLINEPVFTVRQLRLKMQEIGWETTSKKPTERVRAGLQVNRDIFILHENGLASYKPE